MIKVAQGGGLFSDLNLLTVVLCLAIWNWALGASDCYQLTQVATVLDNYLAVNSVLYQERPELPPVPMSSSVCDFAHRPSVP